MAKFIDTIIEQILPCGKKHYIYHNSLYAKLGEEVGLTHNNVNAEADIPLNYINEILSAGKQKPEIKIDGISIYGFLDEIATIKDIESHFNITMK